MNLDNGSVSEFSKDNRDAFASLFKQYYPALCHFAERYIKDPDDCRDVVSDVFSNLWHKKITVTTSVKSYLYATVRNACVDVLRKREQLSKAQKELNTLLPEATYDNEALQQELVLAILGEIKALPPGCRRIFELHYLKGMSSAEIAKQLSLSLQTVKNQRTKAVKLLRRRIYPDELFTVAVISIATAATALLSLSLLLLARLFLHL